MKAKLPMTDRQIGEKIKAGKNFWVQTNTERKAAKNAATFIGVDVMTRKVKRGVGFNIYFVEPLWKR